MPDDGIVSGEEAGPNDLTCFKGLRQRWEHLSLILIQISSK